MKVTSFVKQFSVARVMVAICLCGLSACTASAQRKVSAAEQLHEIVIEGDRLLVVDHINFAFDSDEILDNSTALLDHIAELLSHHSEIEGLDIVGHTDAAGGPKHNQDLSERRAAAVVAALKARKVSQSLHSLGVGETKRVCTEDTDTCHARNRRVEFRIAVR